MIASITNFWHDAFRAAEPEEDDYEKARWLLGNLTHYFNGRSHENDDVKTLAQAISAERNVAKANG